ncbi:acyl-lipid (8-3)-desaturase isoform X2 [Folsomia candida]|uniref:acyl-lipid (8-3)-desaturase isoform X2 n=1 Tax=Folsomia candida TaxID=158441 RepID=UPI001604F8BA|nr:acyl-lipid (8-3)-desaturase isoform X2 [Folsomia candida]
MKTSTHARTDLRSRTLISCNQSAAFFRRDKNMSLEQQEQDPSSSSSWVEETRKGCIPSSAVAKQRNEILYEGHFYDVTNWIDRHPGGKIIQFYTAPGEDATLAVQQFHNRSLPKTLAIMRGLPRRKATPEDLANHGAATQHSRHKALSDDFARLESELREEGFFLPSWSHTLFRLLELIALQVTAICCLTSASAWLQVGGILLSALYAGRCGWWMHEGGHHSITGRPRLDRFIQSMVYGLGDGMSARWWSSQHNRHHAMPQRLHADVDLETLPLLAFNKKVMEDRPTSNFFLRHQSKLFVLVDTFLVAIFWKVYLHPRYAWRKGAFSDLFFMSVHYCLILPFGLVNYVVAVWLTSNYIFINFALSHTHMEVSTQSLHWVEYSLAHTTDIEPNWFVDWWMGMLNYQEIGNVICT